MHVELSFVNGQKRWKPDLVLLHVLCLLFPRGILKTVLSPTCTLSTLSKLHGFPSCLSSLFHWPVCPFSNQYCSVLVYSSFSLGFKGRWHVIRSSWSDYGKWWCTTYFKRPEEGLGRKSVKCLSSKYEDLSSDPQHQWKSLVQQYMPQAHNRTGESGSGVMDPWSSWPNRIAESVSFRFSKRPCLR